MIPKHSLIRCIDAIQYCITLLNLKAMIIDKSTHSKNDFEIQSEEKNHSLRKITKIKQLPS